MKKIKYLRFVMIIVIALIIVPNTIYAALGGNLDASIYNSVTSEQATGIDKTISRVLGTVMLVLQIAAMAGVVVTGVKYMYAGSEDKGKIKQTLIWLIIGTIFVFAAPQIIKLIENASNNVF